MPLLMSSKEDFLTGVSFGVSVASGFLAVDRTCSLPTFVFLELADLDITVKKI